VWRWLGKARISLGSVNTRSDAPDGCSHPASREGLYASAGPRAPGGAHKGKKGLTPAAARRTMPRTYQNTAACERGTPACRRRPLRLAGLATLALRPLTRQPTGVPATLAPVPLAARDALAACPQLPRQDIEHSPG
jgi:hypothetical protein